MGRREGCHGKLAKEVITEDNFWRRKKLIIKVSMFKFFEKNEVLKSILVLCCFIFISYIIYSPTLHSSPLWDDWFFIFKSKTLKNVSPFQFWIWGEYRRSWPLFFTFLSIMQKYWGMNVFNYHLFSLVLHSANSFLIYNIIKKIKGSNAFLIALLCLVHPLQFYSVVWIIQFKTLMCIFFFLLSFIFFLDSEEKKSKTSYILSIAFFACSLLSKSAFAPIAVLLIFYKNKIRILPFILICIYAVGLTLWTTHVKKIIKHEIVPSEVVPIALVAEHPIVAAVNIRPSYTKPAKILPYEGLAISINNFSKYSFYLIYPWKSLLVHPNTKTDFSYLEIFIGSLTASFFLWLIIRYWEGQNFIGLGGIVFFILALFPLSGIINIPIFRYSNFIEYWLSVPVLGVLLCLAFEKNKAMPYIISIAILLLGIKTFYVSRAHPESVSMINSSIESSPDEPLIKMILADHYTFEKNYLLARKIYLNILKTSPGDKETLQPLIDKNARALAGEKIDDSTN